MTEEIKTEEIKIIDTTAIITSDEIIQVKEEKKEPYVPKIRPDETMFNSALVLREREKALKAFFEGRTPSSEIHQFEGRGKKQLDYINGYYMFRQISLITGFRWSHEKISTKFRPNESDPLEVITEVVVTIWDSDGTKYTHPGTGSKDVARWGSDGKGHKQSDIISLGDDIKSSETDAIKKALSYFGIGNDVYGHKERTLLLGTGTDPNEQDGEIIDETLDEQDAHKLFSALLKKNHIPYSEAYQNLGTNKIENYVEAWKKLEEWYKKNKDRTLLR